jgi:UDP-glucuronate 4-epimerase
MLMSKILVTGAAGFIGSHLCHRLLADGHSVTGLDNLNDYYDVRLKEDRVQRMEGQPGFRFIKMDLVNRKDLSALFERERFDRVAHLAAQPGVRYSLENPRAYIDSNIVGFANILEDCRHNEIQHLVYASSSSVYGANESVPFSVHDNVDHPLSLYAASKKANELMAHTYSHLYNLPTTGLRFFTVYGPWGRPDMAYFLFTRAILEGKPIDVYNYGKMRRDFTFIDDIIEGVARVLDQPAAPNPDWDGKHPDPATSRASWRVYNIGNNNPVELEEFIQTIEDALGKKAKRNMMPIQPGDMLETFANIDSLVEQAGFMPTTTIKDGIRVFVEWYRDYYGK